MIFEIGHQRDDHKGAEERRPKNKFSPFTRTPRYFGRFSYLNVFFFFAIETKNAIIKKNLMLWNPRVHCYIIGQIFVLIKFNIEPIYLNCTISTIKIKTATKSPIPF